MSIYKRVAGDFIIETVGDHTVTFQGETANAATVLINGDLTVTGNASLTGNIAGDRITNGTTEIAIPMLNGNVTISVAGVSNVLTVSSTAVAVSGNLSVSGNTVTTGSISSAGNVTGANLNTAGNVWITRDASVGQPTIRFTDTDSTVANGQIFGSVEWFTSDASLSGPRVTSALRSIAAGELGNATVQILTSTGGAAATPKVTVLSNGNVGIGNTEPGNTFCVEGTIFGSSTLVTTGNITGGNILTAGNVLATATVSAGNITTSGSVSATGNVVAGNIVSLGIVVSGAPGVSATGNITGGNIVSEADITAVGDVSAFDLMLQGNISADGNISANNASIGGNVSVTGNVSTTNSISTGNLTINTQISGPGIGVDNTVWQVEAANISSVTMANVGNLTFTALGNYVYKFQAYLPLYPEGSTNTEFAVLFDNGSCNYTLETQSAPTAAWAVASSTVSDTTGTSQVMTGTDMRTVRVSGTFSHTANTAVSLRAQTSAANIVVPPGAHLTYTRIG